MKLRVLLVCLFAVAPAWVAAQPQPLDVQVVAKYSAAQVQTAVGTLRAVVRDGLATEEDLAIARRGLRVLQVRASQLAAASAPRKDALDPAMALSAEIRNLIAAVDAKLGMAGAAPATRSLLPVPVFAERRELSDLANVLQTARANLREQLFDDNANAAKTETLLAEMISAEERLAWAAGWPYTSEEAAEVKALRAGKVADMEGIVKLAGGRLARGVARINAQLSVEADSVGRAAPMAFAIHRPTTQSGQRIVDRRFAEWLSTELGVRVPSDSPALAVLARGTLRFDEAAAAALRGQ